MGEGDSGAFIKTRPMVGERFMGTSNTHGFYFAIRRKFEIGIVRIFYPLLNTQIVQIILVVGYGNGCWAFAGRGFAFSHEPIFLRVGREFDLVDFSLAVTDIFFFYEVAGRVGE